MDGKLLFEGYCEFPQSPFEGCFYPMQGNVEQVIQKASLKADYPINGILPIFNLRKANGASRVQFLFNTHDEIKRNSLQGVTLANL